MQSGRRGATLIFLGILALASCGRAKPNAPSVPPGVNTLSDGLVFTRADSTVILMGKTYAVCCSTWEAGAIDREALKVFFYDATKRHSYWKLFVIPDIALAASVFALPTPGPGQGAVAITVTDVSTGNTASSDRPGSEGTITIHALGCGPPTRLDTTVDATLGSQTAGGPAIHVRGRFVATTYTNPISCVFSF